MAQQCDGHADDHSSNDHQQVAHRKAVGIQAVSSDSKQLVVLGDKYVQQACDPQYREKQQQLVARRWWLAVLQQEPVTGEEKTHGVNQYSDMDHAFEYKQEQVIRNKQHAAEQYCQDRCEKNAKPRFAGFSRCQCIPAKYPQPEETRRA